MSKPSWLCYEDRHVLIAAKPAGLLAVADDSKQPALSDWVKAYYQTTLEPGKKGYCEPMHQIDKPTSGLLVFALSGKAAERFGPMFASRAMTKTYFAIVASTQLPELGKAVRAQDHLLKDGPKVRVVPAETHGTKAADLTYTMLASEGPFGLLQVQLGTGRTHQIRVQLSSRGWPIVGDELYGSQHRPNALTGIALQAQRLSFAHPVGKEPMNFELPFPEEWQQLWPRLLASLPSKNPL